MHEVKINDDKNAQIIENSERNAELGENAQPAPEDCSLFSILIAQAEKDERIIKQMAAAVKVGDKDMVFALAEELTCMTK